MKTKICYFCLGVLFVILGLLISPKVFSEKPKICFECEEETYSLLKNNKDYLDAMIYETIGELYLPPAEFEFVRKMRVEFLKNKIKWLQEEWKEEEFNNDSSIVLDSL